MLKEKYIRSFNGMHTLDFFFFRSSTMDYQQVWDESSQNPT